MIEYLVLLILSFTINEKCKVNYLNCNLQRLDSIILAESSRSGILKINTTRVCSRMKIIHSIGIGKHCLLVDSVILDKLPEGVYEVYLTLKPIKVGIKLNSSSSSFVGILNLYFQNSQSTAHNLSLNLDNFNKLNWLPLKPGSYLYVTIEFKGNNLSSGGTVSHSGMLSFGKMKLIQFN